MIQIDQSRKMNIPNDEKTIGYVNDTNVATRIFSIPKMYGSIDLSDYIFKLDMVKADETKGVIDLVKTIDGDTIYLTWNITGDVLTINGINQIQIRAYLDEDADEEIDYVWHSAIDRVTVENSLEASGEFTSNQLNAVLQAESRIALMVQTIEDAQEQLESHIEDFSVWETFDNSKSYNVSNKVYYEGSSYICVSNTAAGTLPTDTEHWQLIVEKGEDGIIGADGRSATIEIGTVTTGEANVENVGTETDAVFNFTIPKGDKGDTGEKGTDGVSPTASVSKVGNTATITITDANGTTTANISDGIDGQDGINGTNGQDGLTPILVYGSTTTLEPNQPASATLEDLGDSIYELSLSIPKGQQGQSGSGTGDMNSSVYDTHNKAQDIFDYVDNHTDTTLSSRVSTLESTITAKANTSDVITYTVEGVI